MRRVIANLFASLDGFAVDRDVEMRWVTDNYGKEKEKFVHDAHHSMDVMLLGRVTYQELAEYWPNASVEEEPLADRMNSIPKVVFSKTLEEPLAWSNATLARGDLADEVSALKRRPGKEIGIVGSVALTQTLAGLGLLDGLRLLVHPVALGGDGRKPIFEGYGMTGLELADATVLDSDVVALEYRLIGAQVQDPDGNISGLLQEVRD